MSVFQEKQKTKYLLCQKIIVKTIKLKRTDINLMQSKQIIIVDLKYTSNTKQIVEKRKDYNNKLNKSYYYIYFHLLQHQNYKKNKAS